MIKVNGSLINEMQIIGIGPLYQTTIVDAFGSTKFYYNLYLWNYSIEISTDKMNTFFEQTKIEAAKVYEKFRDEYRALYNAIQAGDMETYKTYCALVEMEKCKTYCDQVQQEATQTKNPQA